MAWVITFKDRKHHSNPLFLELNLLDVFKEYIDIQLEYLCIGLRFVQ